MSVINTLYKTIFQVSLSYKLASSVSWVAYTVNMQMFHQCHHLEALSLRRPEWMCRGFPVSVMNVLYNTIFSVSLAYQQQCLSPRDLNNEYAVAFSVSPRNGLLKAIFQVTLLYQFNELGFLVDQNKHTKASQVSLKNGLCKTPSSESPKRPGQRMFSVVFNSIMNEMAFSRPSSKSNHLLKALSPRRPEQWMCTAESSLGSLMNSLFKAIFQVKPSYWLTALSPGRTEQWTCRTKSIPVLWQMAFSRLSF